MVTHGSNVMTKYQVWFVPTRLSAGFNWQPELLLETSDYAEARLTAYLEWCDEPAPDKDAYMVWHVEEINYSKGA
jgi:hypothetical protein